jgi:GT2 family glycosyltransferase
MQISFLIVTKNRPEALVYTLNKLKAIVNALQHEVLVCIDGCLKTESITGEFDWVKWTVSKTGLGASPARALLYKKAQGTYFIGLDDDAHPISSDFITHVISRFTSDPNLGIIAFQEIRGQFKSDADALKQARNIEPYKTNDFVGCGFAIRKAVYLETDGFPVWIDIYGEEPALALEVLNLGYDIWYVPEIKVNHRVDIEQRKLIGRNYFRFEKQLKNAVRSYIVYYPNPYLKILKVLYHNLKKYGLKDIVYFKAFVKVLFVTILKLPYILHYRKPVKSLTLEKRASLKAIAYT